MSDAKIDVVFCGTGWLSIVDVIRERLSDAATIRIRKPATPLADAVRHADVILPSNTRIDASIIAAAERIRLIQQPAAGYEAVDLDAARERGIPVCNAPNTNADAAAQAALLLMLALARRLPEARAQFRAQNVGGPLGVELTGKTLGIIGLGAIGSRLKTAAEALGMSVLSVNSRSASEQLYELLANSDFISLHCPLTPETRGLLSRTLFERVKRGAYLINCARAAIVDRAALEDALDSGRLAGVALDAHWSEPWDSADPLYARPNVVATPHLGGTTREAFARIADVVAENVRRVVTGESLLHRVV